DVTLPPLWRLGPAGQADSISGGVASLQVRSVLPPADSARRPDPKPALDPLARSDASALPVVGAGAVAGRHLAWGRLRRRRRRGAIYATCSPPSIKWPSRPRTARTSARSRNGPARWPRSSRRELRPAAAAPGASGAAAVVVGAGAAVAPPHGRALLRRATGGG